MTDHFIRKDILLPIQAPLSERSVWGWLRKNLFSTPLNIIISLVAIFIVAYLMVPLLNWLVFNAVWSGEDRKVCATLEQGGVMPNDWHGACWAFVKANFGQFIYGRYPLDHLWRVNLMAAIVLLANIPLLMPSVSHKIVNAFISVFIVPIIGYFLLCGGHFGLDHVDTAMWGGLLVTLTIAYTSITISLPLGSLLALGRRSKMKAVKTLCIIFIETIRGIPLVAILFVASVMFPLFLPQGWTFDKLLRALIAVAIFTSAYIAEVIRGGFQAIPVGQYEASKSLGLSHFKMMKLVILPQVYSLIIPSLINVLIGMFKETSLVYIIGMFDLLGIVRQAIQQAAWSTPQTPATGMIFIGMVFWCFCFAMSRYAHFIEQKLNAARNHDE